MDKNTQVRAGWINSGDRKHKIKQKTIKKESRFILGNVVVRKRKNNILTT